jgi:hypothetical protein
MKTRRSGRVANEPDDIKRVLFCESHGDQARENQIRK